MKVAQILFAAAIPIVSVFSHADAQRYASAILGAAVGAIEAILQLGQYQQNWLLYRATREALRREELLYTQNAGPYTQAGDDASRIFVERADAIMSGENTKWIASQQQPSKAQAK